ncbi:MAG: ribonuclease III [Bacteroidales bacterium]|jgi:ribonuclease-3|nr:ribonuclease III [Bacteroidales bacterium]
MLGFKPSNLRLYETALLHRSATFTLPDGRRINNERLEYLGDSVINTVISDYLFEKYPEANEGFMTKVRARIANRDVLNQLAVSLGIDRLLICNISATHTIKNLFGDALEALVGAIFLDRGLKKTKKIFIDRVLRRYLDLEAIINTDADYKSLVFEWVQKHKSSLMFKYNEKYDTNKKKSVFTTRLFIDRQELALGYGMSKKEAEQQASSIALKRLKGIAVN